MTIVAGMLHSSMLAIEAIRAYPPVVVISIAVLAAVVYLAIYLAPRRRSIIEWRKNRKS